MRSWLFDDELQGDRQASLYIHLEDDDDPSKQTNIDVANLTKFCISKQEGRTTEPQRGIVCN